MSNFGSIKKCTIEGIPYNILADANLKHTFSKYKNEYVRTSGGTMVIKKAQVPIVEGVELAVTGAELSTIKSHIESLSEKVRFAFTEVDGTQYKGQGQIDSEPRETENGKVTLTFIPKDDWEIITA